MDHSKPITADNWSGCLLTLEGHSNGVNSVAWSHDATRLASASGDKTTDMGFGDRPVRVDAQYWSFHTQSRVYGHNSELLATECGTFGLQQVTKSALDPPFADSLSPKAVEMA